MPRHPPPVFCPMCGTRLQVVRHVMGSVYEVMCEAEECEASSVILTHDAVKMPSSHLSR